LSCAPQPIERCHFALEFGFLDKVLEDAESLTAAIKRSISIIAREVLPKF